MYGVYNVGQLNANKAKTVNAADAAALAGATVQARLLNLMAYNNRALMANEAFLIQMLSMESWLGYFSSTASNIGSVIDIIATFAPPVRAAAVLLNRTAQSADRARGRLTTANDTIVQTLELSKRGIALAHSIASSGGGLLAQDAASRVVAGNRTTMGARIDAGFEVDDRPAVRVVTVAANQADWIRFTRQYKGDERTDARRVLVASTDPFSVHRPGSAWLNVSVYCVGGLEKRGGSRLVGFNRWETQDTLELWTPGKLCRRNWTPVGWGRANADLAGSNGTTWSPRRAAQRLARQDGAGGGHSHANWTGVPAVYDVSDKRAQSRATLGVDFKVAVRRPQVNMATSSQLGMGATHASPLGASNMEERLSSEQLTAVAKARVFFERPQRGVTNDFTATTLWRPDRAREYGSLFSPYFQSTLPATMASGPLKSPARPPRPEELCSKPSDVMEPVIMKSAASACTFLPTSASSLLISSSWARSMTSKQPVCDKAVDSMSVIPAPTPVYVGWSTALPTPTYSHQR
jgi:hypothetical protein